MCVLTLTIEVTAALKEVRLTTQPIPDDTLVIGMTSDTGDTSDTSDTGDTSDISDTSDNDK